VSYIYQSVCQEYNLEHAYSSILSPLKRLELAGFIKIGLNKKGSTKITEIGFGKNTPEVIKSLLYKDPDYPKYKYFEPFPPKNYYNTPFLPKCGYPEIILKYSNQIRYD